MKQNFNTLKNKFGKLDTALYKFYERYNKKCENIANFLIEEVISDYVEDEIHAFYVDYTFSDGLALHIELKGMGCKDVVCGVNIIFNLFLKEQRKLSIKEIIDKASF